MLLAGAVSGVCSIGFCGALDGKLAVGDVVVATMVVATMVDAGAEKFEVTDPRGPASESGVVASVSRIAATAAEKKTLRATGASIVEMEAAGCARGRRI